eukprot:CAMPEP_0196805396 /NCGR_PEP_ID=MMETSP1362-20130617/5158_1 /TAXON_ID=163516 /ORGANISM="Leptocylindrus danicus, Strain CCMP1856" /LENGTH=661 /DNA_ID=CAMNT_0042178287 /DNA_START=119 /DNA_END=2101 /DNA_ORIENTATION=+
MPPAHPAPSRLPPMGPNNHEPLSSPLALPYLPPLTRTIAHYERIEQIGEETYGQVYKARCLQTNQIVALKKIRVTTGNSGNHYSGLPLTAIREIKILKQLRHPCMVRMLEVVTSKGVEDLDQEDEYQARNNKASKKSEIKHLKHVGNLFLVLEYVPMDLTGLMDTSFRFNEVQAKCIFRQLLEVLEYIHENKYVHRDLKCSNILLDYHFRLKLADFGLARSIRDDEPMYMYGQTVAHKANYTNKVITLWYRPPELLLGTTEYGTAVDMWSAGCILAELILGRPILPGKSEMEQLKLIFELIGSPETNQWEGYQSLPFVQSGKADITKYLPLKGNLRERFPDRKIPSAAMNLIENLLTMDPRKRMSARRALTSKYFITEPRAPADPWELGRVLDYDDHANFHEFQTKKKRKEAKLLAEAARKDAEKQGLGKREVEEHCQAAYKRHMLTKTATPPPPSKDKTKTAADKAETSASVGSKRGREREEKKLKTTKQEEQQKEKEAHDDGKDRKARSDDRESKERKRERERNRERERERDRDRNRERYRERDQSSSRRKREDAETRKTKTKPTTDESKVKVEQERAAEKEHTAITADDQSKSSRSSRERHRQERERDRDRDRDKQPKPSRPDDDDSHNSHSHKDRNHRGHYDNRDVRGGRRSDIRSG